jgi:hypothetical protein
MATHPFLLAPLPHCAILVDRHVHKNGGSSMRAILLENDVLDDWTYWGYGLDHMPQVASKLTAAIGTNCTSWSDWAARPPLRLAAELHYGNTLPGIGRSLFRHFGVQSPLRQAALRCACKVVLVTRLREPVSFYTSFWRWARVDRKQASNASLWGASMVAWARSARNLQAALLMGEVNLALVPQYVPPHGANGRKYSPFHAFDEPASWPAGTRSVTDTVGAARVARLRRALREFNLVGLVERFDETLLLLADLAGLRRLLHPSVSPELRPDAPPRWRRRA